MRNFQVSLGELERADGSCMMAQGQTKVLCAVYGPVEPRNIKQERLDRAFLEVICRPSTGLSGPSDRSIEVFIRDTFQNIIVSTLHPRTRISLVFQIIHDDGSLLAACINAAWLALMDAGIPLIAQIVALQITDTEIIDPDAMEESQGLARHTLVLTPPSSIDDYSPHQSNNAAPQKEFQILTWLSVGEFSPVANEENPMSLIFSAGKRVAVDIASAMQSTINSTFDKRIPLMG